MFHNQGAPGAASGAPSTVPGVCLKPSPLRRLLLAFTICSTTAWAAEAPAEKMPEMEPVPGFDDKPTDKAAGDEAWSKSFGEALSALNVQTTWTGYGDFTMVAAPGAPLTFSPASFNTILVARMSEKLSAEVEMEFKPGEFKAEYMLVDYAAVDWLTIRAGKFILPIGKFNETLHPTFRWNMVSRPLVFREVMPAVGTDTGVQVRGRHALAKWLKLEWQAYVVNGFQTPTADFANALSDDQEVLRAARADDRSDNNTDKAMGGHVTLLAFTGREYGATELGFSGYTGAIDPLGARRLNLLDIDAQMVLGLLTLRGEAVQSYLGALDFEKGLYLQASYKVGDVDVAARWDWAVTRPFGGDPLVKRLVAVSASHAVSRYLSLRGEAAIPLGTATPLPTFALMMAFSF